MNEKKEYGKHYLVEFEGCDPERIKYLDTAKAIFLQAVRDSNATLIGDIFHQFEPFGVSGVVLIAESHMSFHTWPEAGYVGLDIFTCGAEMNPESAIATLKEEFHATDVHLEIRVRGTSHE
jgi:S-adenosylmethionine decarboxylase